VSIKAMSHKTASTEYSMSFSLKLSFLKE